MITGHSNRYNVIKPRILVIYEGQICIYKSENIKINFSVLYK